MIRDSGPHGKDGDDDDDVDAVGDDENRNGCDLEHNSAE